MRWPESTNVFCRGGDVECESVREMEAQEMRKGGRYDGAVGRKGVIGDGQRNRDFQPRFSQKAFVSLT